MVKDFWDLGLLCVLIDLFGWYCFWEEMLIGMVLLVGLGGENVFGVVELWK